VKVELSGTAKVLALALAGLLAIGIAIVQWPDAKRYLKIETM
jgi:Family of unknown function (DUF6893)